MREEGGSLLLLDKVRQLELRFKLNTQNCWMNDVKFVLSFPVARRSGAILISRLDLSKVIDPVLRPNFISTARSFNTVIIDPGHGGSDSGATNNLGTEAYYNLRVARKLRVLLEARGFRVVMTRNNNKFLSLQQRVDLANRHANAIFLSIHHNAGGGRNAQGIETFTLSPQGTAHYGRGLKSSDTLRRAGNSQDAANIALATAIHSICQRRTNAFDRGIKRARFNVLTNVRHPAVLLECGFMSHPKEARRIHDNRYQDALAGSVADAVIKFRAAINARNRRN